MVLKFLHRLRSKGPKPRRRTDPFYHSTRWKKLRRYALSREPLCRDPFGEHAEWREVVSATEVDHIVPRRVRTELELTAPMVHQMSIDITDPSRPALWSR